MDNVWAALALIFAGAFFATLIIALFYWGVVRPRLLTLREPAAPDSNLAALNEQTQQAVQTLSEALVRHSALVARLPTHFEIRGPSLPPGAAGEAETAAEPPPPITAGLDPETRRLLDSVQALAIALNEVKQHSIIQLVEQRGLLDDLQRVLGDLAGYHLQTSAQLTAHGDRLSVQQEALLRELRERYEDLTAQGTRHSAQLTAHGDRLASQQQDLLAELRERHEDLTAQGTRHSAQLTAHGDRLASQQQDLLAELRERHEDLTAQGTRHSAQLTAHSDRLASQQQDLLAELRERHEDLTVQGARHSAQLTAHNDRFSGQQDAWLAELRELLQAVNAAQAQHSAQLTAQGDRLATALAAAAAAPGGVSGGETPAASDELLAALAQLRDQTARQRHAAADLQEQFQRVTERLDLALQGQQTQMALLDALVNRAPPADRLVIREEKMLLQDRLTDIKGIGPVYAGRLHEAGIHSYRQVARLTPPELLQLLNRRAASAAWAAGVIAQAQLLADQRDKTEEGL